MADLNSLAIFAKVVEANSFLEAARRLKMPKSTVSRRVADLEDRLGVRLLERSTRKLRLTDIGAEVLEHAQRSAELSKAVDNLVSSQLSTVAGVLRLSTPLSLSDTLVAPLLRVFQGSYPKVRLQILVTNRFVDPIAPMSSSSPTGPIFLMPSARIGSTCVKPSHQYFRSMEPADTTSSRG